MPQGDILGFAPPLCLAREERELRHGALAPFRRQRRLECDSGGDAAHRDAAPPRGVAEADAVGHQWIGMRDGANLPGDIDEIGSRAVGGAVRKQARL